MRSRGEERSPLAFFPMRAVRRDLQEKVELQVTMDREIWEGMRQRGCRIAFLVQSRAGEALPRTRADSCPCCVFQEGRTPRGQPLGSLEQTPLLYLAEQ